MTIKFRDYYEILGIPRTASDADIKQAYHRLAREHHPDLHSEKEKDLHTKKMQEVNEAYSVLISKENRAKYDQFGEHWKEGPPPPREDRSTPRGSSAQSEEAFSEFFQGLFRQREESGESNQNYSSELDIEASLDLTLEEAVQGVEKSFSLMTTGLCQNCRGTGRRGKTFCPVCGGVGEIRRQREVKTRIPAGLHVGSRIRLKEQGNEGPGGAKGDLYLKIHLLPHQNFKVDGLNLETDVRVMPWAASLGAQVSVQTLEGILRVKVAKGTHTGTLLRLAGKGLGKPGERGDLFVRIQIDIPESLTPKTEALFKQMEEENHV